MASAQAYKLEKQSLWLKAMKKFSRDKAGVLGLVIVSVYFVVACLVWGGLIGTGWADLSDGSRMPPSPEHWFGTNINGQDIFQRAIYSTKTAFEIGLLVAVCATGLGAIFGALAGFFSGTWIDEIILWMCGVLDCIPFYLFVAAVAFALKDNPYAMHIAMIASFWMSTCRYIRGEVIKLKHFEFTEAARALGISQMRIIFRHILPNTTHIILVETSLAFVLAIKTEVILSFLGLGVKDGISWGVMISESSQEVTAGYFGNFLSASLFMFFLVIAFNMFSDALQDALDPRKVS